ncbi:hypothetical protein ABPG77_005758 [Micractinium sp. CCAP 211/92]
MLVLSEDWNPSSCQRGLCKQACTFDLQCTAPIGAFTVYGLMGSNSSGSKGLEQSIYERTNCSGPPFDADAFSQNYQSGALGCIFASLKVLIFYNYLLGHFNSRNVNNALVRNGSFSAPSVDRDALVDALRAAWNVTTWVSRTAAPPQQAAAQRGRHAVADAQSQACRAAAGVGEAGAGHAGLLFAPLAFPSLIHLCLPHESQVTCNPATKALAFVSICFPEPRRLADGTYAGVDANSPPMDCPWDARKDYGTWGGLAGGRPCNGTLYIQPGVAPPEECKTFFPYLLPNGQSGGAQGLSEGAIAGIVVGCVAAVALAALAALVELWRRRARSAKVRLDYDLQSHSLVISEGQRVRLGGEYRPGNHRDQRRANLPQWR